jgi:hypothetical protein
VADSVKGYSLDRFRAHYYLTLARQIFQGQNTLGVGKLCKFKKQRKSSASKLEPLARTPFKAKESEILKVSQTQNVRIRRGSVNLEVPTVRIMKERTPENPRKLKSTLGMYE